MPTGLAIDMLGELPQESRACSTMVSCQCLLEYWPLPQAATLAAMSCHA